MKNKITRIVTPLVLLSVAATPLMAVAQIADTPAPQGIAYVLDLIKTIGNYFFTVLMLLAVIFIIVAAFKYLTAGGDEDDVKKAHSMVIYAGVAILVAVLAKTVIFIVLELAGVEGVSSSFF